MKFKLHHKECVTRLQLANDENYEALTQMTADLLNRQLESATSR